MLYEVITRRDTPAAGSTPRGGRAPGRALALRAAHETIVLLKNHDGLLPLSPESSRTIAVIGPNADRKLLGGYSGEPKYYTSVVQGIREKTAGKINVRITSYNVCYTKLLRPPNRT